MVRQRLIYLALLVVLGGCLHERASESQPAPKGPVAAKSPVAAASDVPLRAVPPPLHEYVTLELYSLAVDGSGEALRLNQRLAPGHDVRYFEISPSSQQVIYVDVGPDDRRDIYSCALDGNGPPRKLTRTSIWDNFTISPDSRYVVWGTVEDELLSRLLDGTETPVELAEQCQGFFWISEENRVVYLRSADLYSRQVDGQGQPARLSDLCDHVDSFAVSADGRWVVYLASNRNGGSRELYSRRIDGGGAPIYLSPSLGTYWTSISISPDSRRVAFRAKLGGAFNLYSTLIDGTGTPVKLNGTDADIGQGTPYACRWSPDSEHAVFQAGECHALYSRSADGQGDPVELSGATHIRYLALSPDGRRVVYLARKEANTYELQSRLVNGNEAARSLYTSPEAGGFVYVDFQVSPDGRDVVFRARASRDSPYELYSRAVDGKKTLRKLSGDLDDGNVSAFRFTPDGAWILYLAAKNDRHAMQLYACPADGSSGPKMMSRPLNPGGGFCKFKISPDGQRILYLAYRSTPQLEQKINDGEGVGSGPGTHLPARHAPYSGSEFH